MGADFIYSFIPYPKMTPARLQEAMDIVHSHAECHDGDVSTAVTVLDQWSNLASRRDVSKMVLDIRNGEYLLTGGLSHGDSPTDAYDLFYAVELIEGLWQQLEDWSVEDDRPDGLDWSMALAKARHELTNQHETTKG